MKVGYAMIAQTIWAKESHMPGPSVGQGNTFHLLEDMATHI